MQSLLQNALVQISLILENNLKLLNDRDVFKTLIYDGAFFQKYQNYFSYFRKKAPFADVL